MEKVKIYCYCRVASKEQSAIEVKKRELNQYADTHGFKIENMTIEQRSGSAPLSERFEYILSQKDIDTVLVPSISGITRKPHIMIGVLNRARENGKTIISIDKNCEQFGKAMSI